MAWHTIRLNRAAVCFLALGPVSGTLPAARADGPDAKALAAHAQAVLRHYCFKCHGENPNNIKGDGLKILDHAYLLRKERKIVVPGKPDDSEMIKQVEDGLMPTGKGPKPSAEDRKALHDWVAAGAPPFPDAGAAPMPGADTAAAPDPDLADHAKAVFRDHCFKCHGGQKSYAGVKVLDREGMVRNNKVAPGKPEESRLFAKITAGDETIMPPPGQPALAADDVEVVRRWIAAGAPAFPDAVAVQDDKKKDKVFDKNNIVGVDHVLKAILAHVNSVHVEERRFFRYFSMNHLITGEPAGATPAELDPYRDALAKAVNHLSLKNELYQPVPIDELHSVYAVDIRRVGWNDRPFNRIKDDQAAGPSDLNFFDLILLEYPYGVVYEDSDTFDHLAEEFLAPAGQVLPIAYLRADWFVSTATLPPLYHDLLQLPLNLQDLEQARLRVNADDDLSQFIATRAGMSVSGVANNNRVVERHPAGDAGTYWKSFDYLTSKGQGNIFKDPINLHPDAHELIFNLPNHLQGYFVTNGQGDRLDAALTDIAIDKLARDKTVRTGLSCMRCHENGMMGASDAVRPTLEGLPGSPGFDKRVARELYPEQARTDADLKADTERFMGAMRRVLGKPQTKEPLTPVTQRFIDEPIDLGTAADELGLARPEDLQAQIRSPGFVAIGLESLVSPGGLVRRDTWEDYFDEAVRQLGLGVPVVPLDGLTRPDFRPAGAAPVDLTASKKGNKLVVYVTNHSDREVYVELVYTFTDGSKVILPLATNKVSAGENYRFPAAGQAIELDAQPGKAEVTLYYSDKPFPPGELLRSASKDPRAYHVGDRVVHRFFTLNPPDKQPLVAFDAGRGVAKKSITVETK